MANEVISVIVPVYNVAPWLTECLQSVEAQRFDGETEVIIVDDGSTDGSGDIADRWAEGKPHVRVIHQPNAGLSAARNAGLDAATGDYVTFVDSDDALHPDFLARLWQHRDADIVAAQYTHDACKMKSRQAPAKELTPEQAIKNTLLQRPRFNNAAWGKLYRRCLFDDDLRFTPGIAYEDLDLFYRLYARARKIAVLPDKLYYYRLRDNSILRQWRPANLDVLSVTARIEAWAPAPLQRAARVRRFAAACTVLGRADDNCERLAEAWQIVKSHRLTPLTTRGTRLRDVAGALAALCGRRTARAVFRRFL